MSKKWTHTACFSAYDTIPKNIRWSWSGRSADGKTVSVTLRKDRFEAGTGTKTYRSSVHEGEERWMSSPGRAELLENLAWARDNCDGIVRVIIALPEDPTAPTRTIRECYPLPKVSMRVVELDDITGRFILQRVE